MMFCLNGMENANERMKIDLHVHTTYSDGDYTPAETVALARGAGLDVIAITDHDECRGFLELHGEARGLTVIPGIELASRFGGEVHVLGFRIDCENKALLGHIAHTYGLRRERAAKIVKKLNSAGIRISMKDVEENCQSGVLGRPHIAGALVKRGYAQNAKEAFIKYLSKHGEYYVPFEKISVEKAAELIIGAGGKPVLAHPGLLPSEAREALFPELKRMGFWGVEAYHPYHSGDQCAEYEKKAMTFGLYVTAGSDFHGSAKPLTEIGAEKRGGEYLRESLEALLDGS